MNLATFEEDVDHEVLDRGKKYFTSGAVSGLEQYDQGLWVADVEGTELYEVNIELNGGVVKYWDCDCPYDHGPVCKHTVAVMYQLRQEVSLKVKKTSKQTTKSKIDVVLAKVSENELHQFVHELAKTDSAFRNRFMIHFSDYVPGRPEEKYEEQIRRLIQQYSHEFGLEHDTLGDFWEALEPIFKHYDRHVAQGNHKEAFIICRELVTQLVGAYKYIDNGYVEMEDDLSTILDRCAALANVAEKPIVHDIVRLLMNEYKKAYRRGDAHYLFLDSLLKMPVDISFRSELIAFLDDEIAARKLDNSDYGLSYMVKAKYGLLVSYGFEEKADALLQGFIHLGEIRHKVLSGLMRQRKYTQAKAICMEGIELANANGNHGLVNSLQEQLLLIAQKTGDVEGVRHWAWVLYLHRYNIEYYQLLKASYTAHEWAHRRQQVFGDLAKHDKSWDLKFSVRADICVEEDEQDVLMALLAKSSSLSFIKEYGKHLGRSYHGQLTELYINGVAAMTSQTGRRVYNDMVFYLAEAQRLIGGKARVERFAKQLLLEYPSRTAMHDVFRSELGVGI